MTKFVGFCPTLSGIFSDGFEYQDHRQNMRVQPLTDDFRT